MKKKTKSFDLIPITISNKVYVPVDTVNTDLIENKYSKKFYVDSVCARCEYREERHSYMCDSCAAFTNDLRVFDYKNIKGVQHIGLPVGDKSNFESVTGLTFDEVKIVDKRSNVKFDYNVKFIAELRTHQKEVKIAFLKKKYGMISAPPRFGKTVVSLDCAISLGYKFVVLAKQHEFLTQFLDHIYGNEEEGIPQCTNIPELEKKYKKKLAGFPKKDADYENYQIMVMTYQQYIHEKGIKRLKLLNANIGTAVIDEVHQSNAKTFAKVIASLNIKHIFGVSGTIERKDGLHWIAKRLVGPVVAKSQIEALTPTVFIHKTDFKPKSQYKSRSPAAWVYANQALAKDKKRNDLIVKQVVDDIKNGYNIVIPVLFKKHVLELQRLINERYGKHICEIFIGGGGKKNKEQRKQILKSVKSNKIKVVVGIRSLLQLGLNVKQWSMLYEICPISNEPNLKQETSRIRTPLEGKKPPIIRMYVDFNLGQSLGCARKSLGHMYKFKYRMAGTKEQKRLRLDVLENNSSSRYIEDAEFKPSKSLFS